MVSVKRSFELEDAQHGSSAVRIALALCAAILFVLPVLSSLGAAPIVIANDALELRLDVEEGPQGHVLLEGLRDRRTGREWLQPPSPLFELFPGDKVWSSDALPIVSVQSNPSQLVVSGGTPGTAAAPP